MKNSTLIAIATGCLLTVAMLLIINRRISRLGPNWLQGQMNCTTYKASSKLAGRIDLMRIEEGDQVRQGELLYRISTPELDAKLSQVEAMEAAASALDRKTLRGARPQQREEAFNQWQKAKAVLDLASKSHDRIRQLYEQGVATAQQYDKAEAEWQAAKATEQMAWAQYELVKSGAEKEDREAAKAQVRQAAGAVAEVESYLNDAQVYSPIDGEVSTITAETGELVSSGFPVVMILDLENQWVEFNIRETLLPGIHLGKQLRGHVPALDREILFQVSYIAPEADYATQTSSRHRGEFDIRTFLIKAKPLYKVKGLRPGMSVLFDWPN